MKLQKIIPVLLFFALVFVAGYFQHDDSDIYGHFAVGNLILHQGILHHEVLSEAGPGREYIPIEWFFQVVLAWTLHTFGFNFYHIFTAIFSVLQIGALYVLLKRVLKVNTIFSILLSTSYTLLNYQFLVARPQIFADLFLILVLIILLRYFLDNKNYLYLLLPITYAWANVHPSVVLGVLLCGAYCFLCFLGIFTKNKKLWLKKFSVLGIYTMLVAGVTILPPQNFNVYRDLLLMYKNNYIMAVVNQEWTPLYKSIDFIIFYSSVIAVSLLIFLVITVYKKAFSKSFWMLPLLVFLPYGYTAIRNIYFGYLVATLLVGWTLAQITWTKGKIVLGILFLLLICGAEAPTTIRNFQAVSPEWPKSAADFILQENLKGNMFNQFGYGNYLEYRLYPKQKVWMDGRAEPFFCCEMPDWYNLQINAQKPIPQYQKIFNGILDKYNFSYAVLVTENEPSGVVLSNMFEKNPLWFLAYKDDLSEIWIKNDGKNNNLLAQLQANKIKPTTASSTQIFSNHDMNLTFTYPTNLTLTQVTPNLLSITPTSKDNLDNTLSIYSIPLPENLDNIKTPFAALGKLLQTTPIPVRGFTAIQQTYSDGTNLLVLRNQTQLIVVRIPKNSGAVSQAITDFADSVKTFR